MRSSIWLAILALCVSSRAEDLRTPGEQVLSELREARARADRRKTVALLREIGGLFRYPASPREAEALLAAAGDATRSKDPVVVRAALRAVGATGSAAGVEYVKPFLRARAGEEPQVVAAAQAAGRLRSASLVAPLADLAKTSADMTVADQALLALGAYREASGDLRRRVTERVLSLSQSHARNRRRWRRLRAPSLRALQRLMGRRLNSVQQFSDWWRYAKTKRDPFGR